ncbi:uncharacterized protein K444DRAFT_624138 [Hyaloscypha bicolor E]|uniref:Uncharacterized protein n=1 Tax=Hyaloscypha bicolor E TaxID=1095630 RepID=A0A2J6TUF3_9HELO|nr:uncharacterized protein K444DRAFT_624138 [Hyaloscypha bicolor E]PMD66649.1 hypothetical protein K444DRAFT_624138 [Hyaloscypha bicolor E]
MCQETHYKYNCNDKHTKCIGVEKKCHLSWAPHGKVKMIRGYINGPCEDCSRIFLAHPARQTYTITPATPVVYTPALSPAPVIVNPAQTILIPAPQPAQIIPTPPPPPPVPTLPQQTPGPGSAGAPLDVPKGWITTGGWEWMKSKNCYEYVAHYKKDPAAPATNRIPANKQGFNTIHGADPGPLPPGWGAQTNPFPAKIGFNTAHGADPGPPPPGMGGAAPVPIPAAVSAMFSALSPAPVLTPVFASPPPPSQSQSQTQPQLQTRSQPQPQASDRPQVRFATPVVITAGANATSNNPPGAGTAAPHGPDSNSGNLTETSTETSGSDTETFTTGSSTSTATV